MQIVNIHQAKTQLSKLIENVLTGQEVIIAKAGKPMVRLQPLHGKLRKRLGGQWRGKISISKDFDKLPDEILHGFSGKTEKRAISR